jgi:hypothetical protein
MAGWGRGRPGNGGHGHAWLGLGQQWLGLTSHDSNGSRPELLRGQQARAMPAHTKVRAGEERIARLLLVAGVVRPMLRTAAGRSSRRWPWQPWQRSCPRTPKRGRGERERERGPTERAKAWGSESSALLLQNHE